MRGAELYSRSDQEGSMSKKKKAKTFDVWIKREHIFTAKIKGDTLEEALALAKSMTIEQLLDAPGETIDSEHRFTAVME
jgi:hypothetical protein